MPAGVGTGFNETSVKTLRAALDKVLRDTPPLQDRGRPARAAISAGSSPLWFARSSS